MNAYHFITHWKLDASCEEVYRTLEDVDGLVKWWPSVYLDIKILEKGKPGGLGKVVALYTKGWLPYTLKWQFRVTQVDFPNGYTLEAWGDFVGKGIWRFTPTENPNQCIATYDWEISAEKPLLKKLSGLLRPIFSANHHWAMDKGEESLKLELMRRNATSSEELAAIPKPPRPTFPHNLLKNEVF